MANSNDNSDTDKQTSITVEVAYATPQRQCIVCVEVPAGTALIEAVKRSQIPDLFPDLDLDTADFGIWGKVKPPKSPLKHGQRIEIYRPLIADPKESRRKRAQRAAKRR